MVSIQTHLPRVQQLLGRVLEDLMARHGRMYAVPEQEPIRPLANGVHGDEEGQARILHILQAIGVGIGHDRVQQCENVQRLELYLR